MAGRADGSGFFVWGACSWNILKDVAGRYRTVPRSP